MDPAQPDAANEANQLLGRAKELMSELTTFVECFTNVADTSSADGAHVAAGALNYFRQQLKSETQGLQGMVEKHIATPDTSLRTYCTSSNLPFFESLWSCAKRSRDIVGLRKWVCGGQYEGKNLLAPGIHVIYTPGDSIPSKYTTTLVDIMADGGQTWIKVVATTSKRLLWDMTKLGWAIGAEDSEDESLMEDDFEDIPLFKAAKSLAVSAEAHRIRNKKPRVQLLLPRIASGESKDVDLVLDSIRRLGIEILCSNQLSPVPTVQLSPELIQQMAPNPLHRFSDVLNIDTSVLIALLSDFSHGVVAKQPWFSAMQLGHLANEGKRNIVPTWLYPAMGSRSLVCTPEAARTCREIVTTLGTPTEIERLGLLLGDEPGDSAAAPLTRAQRLAEFGRLSDHDLPAGLQLPVRVVDGDDSAAAIKRLPAQAWAALGGITEPTKSVFAYGWASGQTTLTSNGVAIHSLTRNLEEQGDEYSGTWPSMWLCPFSRALVGVPKHLREEGEGN
jgi:hypothetical protein